MKTRKWWLVALVCFVSVGASTTSTRGADSEREEWRDAALKQYDQDKNGRLSDAEREAMRKAVFAERRRPSGRGRGIMFPPEIVAKYDKNGDGSLDETEGRAAQQGIRQTFQEMQKKYDTNANGNFEPDEVDKLKADASSGLLEDVPKFVIQILSRQGRRPGPGGSGGAEVNFRKLDQDGDGRLNEKELQAARATLGSGRQTTDKTPPRPAP
jgi:Ca2+-binding EF-hand superfamily protein